jgi:flagella basal body P-ring formation protein FlgA
MRDVALLCMRSLLLGCAAAASFGTIALAGSGNVLPVPTITIYPGDVIRNSYLVDEEFAGNAQTPQSGVINSRLALVGKLARRTLLPGVPIPVNAVSDPNAVSNGTKVRVVFHQGGLLIETYAIALQAGSVGEVISVRNPDSGTTISGIVQSDGSVRVGG